jgi:tyrosine-protein phosphatase SIW14
LSAIAACASENPQKSGDRATSHLYSSGHSSRHSSRPFGQKRKIQGISNFGEVTPTLFRGGQPGHKGFEELARMGVDIVVDARGNRSKTEGKDVRHAGMRYVSIPWHCPFPHDDVFVSFLKLLRENPGKKVFVHCRLGDDRTGMMVAAYRMANEGWTADEAMLEMQYFGFSSAHHIICPRLASYEHDFPKRLRSDPAFRGLR